MGCAYSPNTVTLEGNFETIPKLELRGIKPRAYQEIAEPSISGLYGEIAMK